MRPISKISQMWSHPRPPMVWSCPHTDFLQSSPSELTIQMYFSSKNLWKVCSTSARVDHAWLKSRQRYTSYIQSFTNENNAAAISCLPWYQDFSRFSQGVRSLRSGSFVVSHVHGLADDGFGDDQGAYGKAVAALLEEVALQFVPA